MESLAFDAIGTRWEIDIPNLPHGLSMEGCRSRIMERISEFDRNYSRFRKDSLVWQMSERAGEYHLPGDAKPLFDLYFDLYGRTGGSFTPLIGQTLSEAGYDENYSLEAGQLTTPPAWEEALEYRFPKLIVRRPCLLDFGAAGKGYLVDIVGRLLQNMGIEDFCVDAGGDMLYRTVSGQPLRVGLEHPRNTRQVIGIASLLNRSICGSAGNRRKWGKFHHIMDPQTLSSPTEILAVWTVAETAMIADAMATAVFFVSGPELKQQYDFEYLIVGSDYSVSSSQGFPAELFLTEA